MRKQFHCVTCGDLSEPCKHFPSWQAYEVPSASSPEPAPTDRNCAHRVPMNEPCAECAKLAAPPADEMEQVRDWWKHNCRDLGLQSWTERDLRGAAAFAATERQLYIKAVCDLCSEGRPLHSKPEFGQYWHHVNGGHVWCKAAAIRALATQSGAGNGER